MLIFSKMTILDPFQNPFFPKLRPKPPQFRSKNALGLPNVWSFNIFEVFVVTWCSAPPLGRPLIDLGSILIPFRFGFKFVAFLNSDSFGSFFLHLDCFRFRFWSHFQCKYNSWGTQPRKEPTAKLFEKINRRNPNFPRPRAGMLP